MKICCNAAISPLLVCWQLSSNKSLRKKLHSQFRSWDQAWMGTVLSSSETPRIFLHCPKSNFGSKLKFSVTNCHSNPAILRAF